MPELESRNPQLNPVRGKAEVTSSWKFALRALRSRNYRLFFTGQSVSLIGTWMTQVATSWLVYRLTGSAWLLGIVGFASRIPTFFLAPFAGVWIDRWNRHHTLVVTQILSMLQSFALAWLALAGIITIREVIWLGLAQGVINAFDMPARQAFVIEMVEDRADLGNAIALNSSMVNAARLLGPSIAGVVIAAVGEGYCFLIDGFSYLAVIASLLAMKIRPVERRKASKPVWHELKEGWSYVTHFVPIRSILLLLALVSLVGMQYTVLMPIFAGQVLRGGAAYTGLLDGRIGRGSAYRCNVPGDEKKRARPRTHNSFGIRGFWSRAHCFRPIPSLVAFAIADDVRGGIDDDPDGGQQHRIADHCGRRQTRPRNELLFHGISGNGAIWEFIGGRIGAPDRSAANGDDQRRGMYCGRSVVRIATKHNSKTRAPDLQNLGHHS